MKNLSEMRAKFAYTQKDALSDEDLKYVLGGASDYSGGGSSSSTSGDTCCDGTCVCSIYCCELPEDPKEPSPNPGG